MFEETRNHSSTLKYSNNYGHIITVQNMTALELIMSKFNYIKNVSHSKLEVK